MPADRNPPPGSAPPRFDIFLSYNSHDRASVERIARRLKESGLEPWLDRWSLTPGGEWQRELGAGLDASATCAVFVGPRDLGAWELQEVAVAIDRAATQRGFRVFPVLLPGVEDPFDPNRLPHFLRARTWVDFRRGGDDRRALQDLINAVKGVPFGPDMAVAHGDDVAPYRGLRAFGEDDARFFFGRDGEVQRLLEMLKASRFVAVLGPSGSGKSSLVQAGLVPELRADRAGDGGQWHVVVLRPGAAPLTVLAARLATLLPGQSMQATLDGLAHDPRTLALSVELALADRPPGARVLVIVDQLEEVFTLCRDESERRRLFATLLYATSAAGGRTAVIVTMRADFYARCAPYRELAQLVTAQQMLVGPIEADGLRQAIEQPARRVGLRLEDGLTDTILADIAAEPGALPLLEHALLELWERRRGGLLTLEAYRAAGGVHGALAQRADAIFDALSPGQQQIARRTLLRLTQPGEGTEDTRRRASLDELSPVTGDEGFEVVLGQLVDARLLTTGRDETGQRVVDVSHEALIRGWPRLRGWIDADRAGLLLHRRLADAAREWATLDREPGALYRGARLAAAREWSTEHAGDLSGLERAFVDASQAIENSELQAARSATRRLRILATGSAILTVVVALLAVWALDKGADAQREGNVAREQLTRASTLALASSASALADSRPDIALLLALEARRMSAVVEARSSVLAAFANARDPGLLAILRGSDAIVQCVAFSPDGRTIASCSDDNTVRLWDVRAHKQLGAPLTGHTEIVNSVAFSPDGRRLVSGSNDKTLRLWDVRTHKPIGAPLTGHTDLVFGVAFSSDGHTLASCSKDESVRLWDARTHTQLGARLRGHTDFVYSVAFSPDGRTLASASRDKAIRIWDVRPHRQRGAPLTRHASQVGGVAFSPDGTLASFGSDRAIRLWNVRTRRQVGTPLVGHTGGVNGVAFSPDRRTLVSAAADRTIRLWSVRTHKQLGAPLTGHTNGVNDVAFSSDGRTLASASRDKTIRLWGVRPHTRAMAIAGRSLGFSSVAFSADSSTMATGSTHKTVRLWSARTQQQLGKPLRGHTSFVTSVEFSADGRTLASVGFGDKTIRLWDTRARKQLGKPLIGHTRPVNRVAFGFDGHTLASAGEDKTVRLWDVRSHEQLGKPLVGHTGSVRDVAFSPDGRTLASAAADRTVRLWDVRTHKQLGPPLTGHSDFVNGVAFSFDGRSLATGSADATVRLWDVRTHRQRGVPLTGHLAAVSGVAFSPEGRTLASAGFFDQTVRLWDVRSHKPLGPPLTGHTGSVFDLAFSPDGRTVASAGSADPIRLWQEISWRSVDELAREICQLVGTGLSRTEWAQYAGGVPYRRSCR